MKFEASQYIGTVTLNPTMLPKEKVIISHKPIKPVHVDPRPLPKRCGSGKGNWGSLKDEIDQGLLDFYKQQDKLKRNEIY